MILSIRHLVRINFLIFQLARIVLVICLVSCSQLTKYTPLLLINGACPSPNLKKYVFA